MLSTHSNEENVHFSHSPLSMSSPQQLINIQQVNSQSMVSTGNKKSEGMTRKLSNPKRAGRKMGFYSPWSFRLMMEGKYFKEWTTAIPWHRGYKDNDQVVRLWGLTWMFLLQRGESVRVRFVYKADVYSCFRLGILFLSCFYIWAYDKRLPFFKGPICRIGCPMTPFFYFLSYLSLIPSILPPSLTLFATCFSYPLSKPSL